MVSKAGSEDRLELEIRHSRDSGEMEEDEVLWTLSRELAEVEGARGGTEHSAEGEALAPSLAVAVQRVVLAESRLVDEREEQQLDEEEVRLEADSEERRPVVLEERSEPSPLRLTVESAPISPSRL